MQLLGSDVVARCLDGTDRRYADLDAAASTGALDSVAARVNAFLPEYASVHRGTGYKSIVSSLAYEQARQAVSRFCGREDRDDVVVLCRNTTEAINHLAYRLRLNRDDVVVTTLVEHHANLLPWGRAATRRIIGCDPSGRFDLDEVRSALRVEPRPRLLAVTGASNVTGWLPPIDAIIEVAHELEVPVLVDAAQLAPHRRLPGDADYVVFSGHKLYAPFGTGALIGPRSTFADGDPFLVGGGAVDLVDLDEVVWTTPPEREEAGSPNVVGAVALHAAIDALEAVGFTAIERHDDDNAARLLSGLAAIDGVRLLGPGPGSGTLPVATFVVEAVPHALVAARLSAEFAIGVRHGCFCAHPYLVRLLGLQGESLRKFRDHARNHHVVDLPGAVRASCGITTSSDEIDRLIEAVQQIATTDAPAEYRLDERTGEWWPEGLARPDDGFAPLPGCGPG